MGTISKLGQNACSLLENFAIMGTWLLPESTATAPDTADSLIIFLCLKCKLPKAGSDWIWCQPCPVE